MAMIGTDLKQRIWEIQAKVFKPFNRDAAPLTVFELKSFLKIFPNSVFCI